MKIYLLPGLGFDCRIFDRLDFKGLDVEYINWIEPQQHENIREYSKRLFHKLPETEAGSILIGHSFGGIVAQEIATWKRVEKVILISSVKARSEIPGYFRILKPLKLYKFFTKELSIRTVNYWGPKHDLSNAEVLELFKSMVGRQSNNYLQWALKALSAWHAPSLPESTPVFQIHGTADKTFPISLIKNPNAVVEGGTHMMVYKQPDSISEIIRKEILSGLQ
ncbi:MAG: alpha/beta hydrolase [Saprospiraceae bacterium]|nr:alpha/beta hydrolase [Saprospiraceae bacterium]